jgi:tetratricopeptide (TPR) repeat protein
MLVAEVEGPFHSHHERAERAARNAVLHYRRAGWPYSACLATIAGALYYGPTPVTEAIAACRELLPETDANGQAGMLAFLGALEAMRGDFDAARACVAQCRKGYGELGQALGAERSAGSVESEIEFLAGDLAAARASLESSSAVLEQHGDRAYLATRAASLADVLYRQGKLDEAARQVRAAESGSTSDDVATQWRWRAVDAKLAARSGEFERAEALARDALGLLDDGDTLNERAMCLLDLGEVLALAGRPAEAAAAFGQALDLFERKGNVVAADQTRVLLAETTESP